MMKNLFQMNRQNLIKFLEKLRKMQNKQNRQKL